MENSTQVIYPFFELPNDLIEYILDLLDPVSFWSVRVSCTRLFELTENLADAMFRMRWFQIKEMSYSIHILWNSDPFLFRPNHFLLGSIEKLEETAEKYIDAHIIQCPSRRYTKGSCMSLLNLLWNHVVSMRKVVRDVIHGESKVSDNFEILDFCLRRYVGELQTTFPIVANSKSTEQYFDVWNRLFEDNVVVPHATFIEKTKPLLRFSDHEAHKNFIFYSNFPRDNIMTPYRFEILCCQFGFSDWSRFSTSFESMVCHSPFVGILNAESSKRYLEPNTFLIRFSRTCPNKLTLTCCFYSMLNRNLEYKSIRSEKNGIRSIVKMMNKRAGGCLRPAKFYFNGAELAERVTLTEYVSDPQSYIQPTPQRYIFVDYSK